MDFIIVNNLNFKANSKMWLVDSLQVDAILWRFKIKGGGGISRYI